MIFRPMPHQLNERAGPAQAPGLQKSTRWFANRMPPAREGQSAPTIRLWEKPNCENAIAFARCWPEPADNGDHEGGKSTQAGSQRDQNKTGVEGKNRVYQGKQQEPDTKKYRSDRQDQPWPESVNQPTLKRAKDAAFHSSQSKRASHQCFRPTKNLRPETPCTRRMTASTTRTTAIAHRLKRQQSTNHKKYGREAGRPRQLYQEGVLTRLCIIR